MKDLLREAFTLACHGLQTINTIYDRAGCYFWRAMMDEKFLAVDHTRLKSGPLRDAAQTYDWAKGKAQNYLYKDILHKGATGNVGPKPNYKPVLIKAFQTAAPYLARVNIANPTVAAITICAVICASHALSQNGPGMVPDMVATWYGANIPGHTAPKRN